MTKHHAVENITFDLSSRNQDALALCHKNASRGYGPRPAHYFKEH